MKIFKSIVPYAIMLMVSFAATNFLVAQTQTKVTQASAASESTTKTIGFRLTEWKTSHSHDVGATSKLVEALEKIGCEVIRQDHNGHMDVRYRCPQWKSITVENNDYVIQWSAWLAGHGLETVVVDPPTTPGAEVVRFRLGEWRSAHLHDAAEAESFGRMLKIVGCETERSEHDGHIDLRFRCEQWRTIGLPTHEAAHGWQEWLNRNGFQTEHRH